MTRSYIAAAAMLLLAACGPPAATTEEAPAAPQSLFEEVNAMGGEAQLVFAYQKLIEAQQANPELQPPCSAVRGTERINVPENIAPDSIYAPHVGSAVFSVNCGELRSATRLDPSEHWLVVIAPGATAPAILSCLGPRDSDLCPRNLNWCG